MLQRVLGRGTTQDAWGISPERLTCTNPGLHATAGGSACRAAPGASASEKRLVTAREDREEDGSPTVGVAHEVEKVAHGGLDDLRTTDSGGQSGMPARGRRRGRPTAMYLFT